MDQIYRLPEPKIIKIKPGRWYISLP